MTALIHVLKKQNKTTTTTTLKTAEKQNKLILNNWKIESCDPKPKHDRFNHDLSA